MGERVYKKKGRMKESDIFIEVDCFQKNKADNIVCGDSYMSQKLKEEDRLAEAVLPVEEVFKELPEIRSDTEELDKLLKNGNPFRSRAVKDVKGGDMFRVYHSDGTFIGVFKYDEEKHMYYPEKIFLGGN